MFVGIKLNTYSAPDEPLSLDLSLSETLLLRVRSLGALEIEFSITWSLLFDFFEDLASLICEGISTMDYILVGPFWLSSNCLILYFLWITVPPTVFYFPDVIEFVVSPESFVYKGVKILFLFLR